MEGNHEIYSINDDPYVVGKWEMIEAQFQGSPTHVALLPNNKIFAYGGSSLDRCAFEYPPPAEILDLDTMQTRRISMEGVKGDLWCGGHTLLEDGNLLFLGGTAAYPPSGEGIFKGHQQACIFDPFTEKWEPLPDMIKGRWYPTAIRTADNSVLVIAGFPEGEEGQALGLKDIKQPVQEIFRRDSGWSTMVEERMFPLYPRLHLLPDGDVFYSGVFNTHFFFPGLFPSSRWDHKTRKWSKLGGHHAEKNREEGISLILALRPPDYEARIMVAGGGNAALFRNLVTFLQRFGKESWIENLGSNQALASVDIIEIPRQESGNQITEKPRWTKKSEMHKRRIHAVGVLLPDGKVLVVGGMSRHGHVEGSQIEKFAVHEPEMYDPVNDTWCLLPRQERGRVYHSTAILLPDGRVISMGSNPHDGMIEKTIEIYSPPYLFRGERPIIQDFPETVGYGTNFEIHLEKPQNIKQVVLRRLDVLTHVTNTDQRLIELSSEKFGKSKLGIRIPDDRALIPEGYYLLYVLNTVGVPSVGKYVLVQ